ncbi:MAG TPA: hypothetical protein VNK04_16135 [Gemmataceae bacterium]|nr:hypothetical protein [Gemmataceae bacterium]
MSFEPEHHPVESGPPRTSEATGRLTLPGVFLIVVGALNLIAAIGLLLIGLFFTTIPPEEFDKMVQQDPAQRQRMEMLREEDWSTQDLLNIYIYGGLGSGAVVLVASLLIVIGGVCMLARRGRVMAILGSITAGLPCISPLSCCLVGMAIGIWAVVVLLSPDGKTAFESHPGDLPPPGPVAY